MYHMNFTNLPIAQHLEMGDLIYTLRTRVAHQHSLDLVWVNENEKVYASRDTRQTHRCNKEFEFRVNTFALLYSANSCSKIHDSRRESVTILNWQS